MAKTRNIYFHPFKVYNSMMYRNLILGAWYSIYIRCFQWYLLSIVSLGAFSPNKRFFVKLSQRETNNNNYKSIHVS